MVSVVVVALVIGNIHASTAECLREQYIYLRRKSVIQKKEENAKSKRERKHECTNTHTKINIIFGCTRIAVSI